MKFNPFEFKSSPGVYVLELEGGNFYVGETSDIRRKLQDYFSGNRSTWWVSQHPIVGVHQTLYCSYEKRRFFEIETTIEYMRMYGWEKVRGGYWNYNLKSPPKILLCNFPKCRNIATHGLLCKSPTGSDCDLQYKFCDSHLKEMQEKISLEEIQVVPVEEIG